MFGVRTPGYAPSKTGGKEYPAGQETAETVGRIDKDEVAWSM